MFSASESSRHIPVLRRDSDQHPRIDVQPPTSSEDSNDDFYPHLYAPTPRRASNPSPFGTPEAITSSRLPSAPLPARHTLSTSSDETRQSIGSHYPLVSNPGQQELNAIKIPSYDTRHWYDPKKSTPSPQNQRGESISPLRRSARISPDIVEQPPSRPREPPAHGATPLRPALKRTLPDVQRSPAHTAPVSPVGGRDPLSWRPPTREPPSPRSNSRAPSPRPRSSSPPRREWNPPSSSPPSPETCHCDCGGHKRTRSISHGPHPRHTWQPTPAQSKEMPLIPDFNGYPAVPTNAWDQNFHKTPETHCQYVPSQQTRPTVVSAPNTPYRGPHTPYAAGHPVVLSTYAPTPYATSYQGLGTPYYLTIPHNTVDQAVIQLIRTPADRVSWQSRAGEVSWTPHPMPAPAVSPHSFWGSGVLSSSPVYNHQPPYVGAQSMGLLTGGNPLPGTAPGWSPGVWPPRAAVPGTPIILAPYIIPNPANAHLPHFMWDVSASPETAKRITGNHIILDVQDKFQEPITFPPVERVVVRVNVGVAEALWGPIEVKQSSKKNKGVTIFDVLNSIHEYFQIGVGRREIERISNALGDGEVYHKMADAMYQRCITTPALPGYEMRAGLKRIDCLGDATFFWGLYITYNDDMTWQLNLGLVNRKRMAC